MREKIADAMKQAMRDKDQTRLATLRLMSAAIKDRDMAVRMNDETSGHHAPEAEIMALLDKMVQQRAESATAYEEGGRLELAERERAEMAIIREFMPKPLSPAEVDAAVKGVVEELGASGIKDMGRVMAELKKRHAGQMDFAVAGAQARAMLSG